MEIVYTPYDIANFIINADFNLSDERKVIHNLWMNEKRYLSTEYHENKLLLCRRIEAESYIHSVNGSLNELNSILSDSDTEYSILDPQYEEDAILHYLKITKLKLMYIDGCDYVKIKMRNLLKRFGYKRRSVVLVEHMTNALNALSLKTYLRGNVPCYISDVKIDDMIIIRLGLKLGK